MTYYLLVLFLYSLSVLKWRRMNGRKFIKEHGLFNEGWTHAHDPKGGNQFRYMYNIESTPLILVLDPNKEIIAKRINIDDIKNLIEFDMRTVKVVSEN